MYTVVARLSGPPKSDPRLYPAVFREVNRHHTFKQPPINVVRASIRALVMGSRVAGYTGYSCILQVNVHVVKMRRLQVQVLPFLLALGYSCVLAYCTPAIQPELPNCLLFRRILLVLRICTFSKFYSSL